jgi:hypothetical protein
MSFVDEAFADRDVFLKWLMARVDHDRAVKTRRDAVVTGFLVAMIEMHGENGVRKHSLGRADHRFEHALVRIFSRAFGKLDDEWRFALDVTAEESEQLFHVVNVVSAHREFAVSDFVKLCSRNNHKPGRYRSSREKRRIETNLAVKSEIGNPKFLSDRARLPAT